MIKYYIIKDGGTVATTADQGYTMNQIVDAVTANQIDKTWWCYYESEDGKLHKIKIEKLLKKASQEEVQQVANEEAQQASEEQKTPEVPDAPKVPDIPEVQQAPEVQQPAQEEVKPTIKETYKAKFNELIENIKDKFNKFISWLKVWTLRASVVVAVLLGGYVWLLHHNVEKKIKVRDEANKILVKMNSDYEDKIKTLKSDNSNYANKIKSLKSDIEQLKAQSADVPAYSGKSPMSDEIAAKRREEFSQANQEYLEACEDHWYLTESWQLSRKAEALAKWGKAYERLFIYADAKASKDINKNEYASLYAMYVASAIYTGHINDPSIGLEEGVKMCLQDWKSVKDFVLNLEMEPHQRKAIEALK